jgi:hypothetical protein
MRQGAKAAQARERNAKANAKGPTSQLASNAVSPGPLIRVKLDMDDQSGYERVVLSYT